MTQQSPQTLKDLAALRHKQMAPVTVDKGEELSIDRSKTRKEFSENVVKKGIEIACKLAKKSEWRKIFNREVWN